MSIDHEKLLVVARMGITFAEASRAFLTLAEAVAKVPFPEGRYLRALLLRAWKREKGAFRFFYPAWWTVAFGKWD